MVCVFWAILGFRLCWAAYPEFMKNGISLSKTGFHKYGRTNAPPFSAPLPFYSVPFSVPFPFILEKTKTDGKIWYTVADETGFIPSVQLISGCDSIGMR
jgi:hypothetical protein